MNRERKYRVWCARTKTMHYPEKYDYIRIFNDGSGALIRDYGDEESELAGFNGESENDARGYLMDHVGLKDKNGVDVYESDLIKPLDEDSVYYLVKWNSKEARFQVNSYGYAIYLGEGSQEVYSNKISMLDKDVIALHEDEFEIIGNIYQNPDLLTQTKSINH